MQAGRELFRLWHKRVLIDNNLPPKEFTGDALHKLKCHHYPGNVRELAKIVKNAAIFCAADRIGPDDIDFEERPEHNDLLHRTRTMTLAQSKEIFERELVLDRLRLFKNDVPKTAESLGIIKNNFYRKLKELGISGRPETKIRYVEKIVLERILKPSYLLLSGSLSG